MAGNYKSDQMRRAEMHGWYFYIVAEPSARYSKFGTTGDVMRRLEGLTDGNPRALKIAASWRVQSREEAFEIERQMRARFSSRLVRGRRDWVQEYAHALVQSAHEIIQALEIEVEQVRP